jgi:hypothetical protein
VSSYIAIAVAALILLTFAELWPLGALLVVWLLGKAARRLSVRSADAGRGGARATVGKLAPIRALAQYDDVKAREEFSRCISSSGIALPRQGAARIGAKRGKKKGARASPGVRC